MASTTDIRKGLKIQIDGVPYHIVDHQFVKPGKGQAFTRVKIRNMATGAVLEWVMPAGAVADWGWRIPFWIGLFVGVAGLMLRRGPDYTAMLEPVFGAEGLRGVLELPIAFPRP